jgi:hypothetical protein
MNSTLVTSARKILSSHIRQQAALAPQHRCFSEGGDRIHSTDIAFKPNESGWGGSRKYETRWDDIFGKKKDEKKSDGGDGDVGDSKKK